MHPVLNEVTQRIRERSAVTRSDYLARMRRYEGRPRGHERLGCSNVAHAFAAMPEQDKLRIAVGRPPHLGIVSAYNDVLSAHRPYERYPERIRATAASLGATAQVAGGTPAMCDGVTQGQPGMELSLFSRDVIALSTAVALSHDTFDAVLLLGVCDKIVPGLLIGALHFGHLPCVFVPAGPMGTGISNAEKARTRELFAEGKVGRIELLAAEEGAYHSPGTCTFYGTANSNQMLLEAMGLHVPGSAFIHPADSLRGALTDEAVATAVRISGRCPDSAARPIGHIVDERAIVNAMVALLATGGSTNHLLHWVAIARAAGIVINWGDFSALSGVVPLLTRVYPNGSADVNGFQAAGGPGFVIRELLDAGLMHEDVLTVAGDSLRPYTRWPCGVNARGMVEREPVPPVSGDDAIVRTVAAPFSATGGLKLLQGNLGRAVIKSSAVPEDRHTVEAPCRIFTTQAAMLAAFDAGELERDVVVVVRFQGPHANGMPELHKLTPALAVLQSKGFRVALVTDGRMSGASGKVPAAIHVSPEALAGGSLAKLRDGDTVRVCVTDGVLHALVDEAEWQAREAATLSPAELDENAHGMGRELFAGLRRNVTSAEEGAVSWL